MTTQNLWDAPKAVLREGSLCNTILPQEIRQTSNRQHNCIPKITGKRRTKKKKSSRRKEVIKIKAEINDKDMKETKVKINKN